MKNKSFLVYLTILFCVFNNQIKAQDSAFCGVVITLADQDNTKYNSQLTTTKVCYNHDAAGNLIGTKKCVASVSSLATLNEGNIQKGPVDLGESLKAYPNPTRGIFYFSQEGNSINPISGIQIVSVNTGAIIKEITNTTSKQITVDLSNQPLGIYIVNILFKNGKNKAIKVIRI